MQFKIWQFQFKTNWLSTVITLICIPLFIKLGLWQYHKAMIKQHIEDQYQASLVKSSVELSDYLDAPESLEFQKVKVTGHYETQYQILIDNQVENHQSGFHVVTPFKIANSDRYVLVNRGWLAGTQDHQAVPVFDTPSHDMEIEGMLWLPSSKIFTLEAKPQSPNTTQAWSVVWQHLDMKKYQQSAPIEVLNVIIKLDPAQASGGFLRKWQLPPSRIMTNIGYAYQWFGFALATLAIYFYMSISRIKQNG